MSSIAPSEQFYSCHCPTCKGFPIHYKTWRKHNDDLYPPPNSGLNQTANKRLKVSDSADVEAPETFQSLNFEADIDVGPAIDICADAKANPGHAFSGLPFPDADEKEPAAAATGSNVNAFSEDFARVLSDPSALHIENYKEAVESLQQSLEVLEMESDTDELEPDHDIDHMFPDEKHSEHETIASSELVNNLVQELFKPLYDGCDGTVLAVIIILFRLSAKHRIPKAALQAQFDILHWLIPKPNILPSYADSVRVLRLLSGMDIKEYECCSTCSTVFRDRAQRHDPQGEHQFANLQRCPKCDRPRAGARKFTWLGVSQQLAQRFLCWMLFLCYFSDWTHK